MKKGLIVFILIITFVGGYALSFGVNHWRFSNPKDSFVREPYVKFVSGPLRLTSLAFKINIVNKNKELLGVGFIPTHKIDELMEEVNEDQSLSFPPEVIPTLDVEMITDIPIANENEKYSDYILDLYSEIFQNGEEAKFIP